MMHGLIKRVSKRQGIARFQPNSAGGQGQGGLDAVQNELAALRYCLGSSCHWRPASQAQTTARASMSIDRLNDKV